MNDKIRVLLIERESIKNKIVESYLPSKEGFQVMKFTTLMDAITFLQNTDIDLDIIFCDLDYLEQKDYQDLHSLSKESKDLPIILLSENDQESIISKGNSPLSIGYMVKKELTPQALKRSIQNAMERVAVLKKNQNLEEQLFQAQKMESIGQLAGGVAHEYNNRLATISLLLSQILNEGEIDDKSRRSLEKIDKNCGHAADITRQLLNFSRNEKCKKEVQSIKDIVLLNEELYQKLLGSSIDLQILSIKEDLFCNVEAAKIEQALTNLLINAKDAMPEGGRLIIELTKKKISQSESDKQGLDIGDYAVLKVKDEGIGIPEEIKDKIFEPFFTTKPIGSGTGLGLSVVDGIIKQNNGKLCVKSEKGKGSEFQMYFHLDKSVTKIIAQESIPDKIDIYGNEHILYLEDEPELREVMIEMMEKYGYKVEAPEDAREAIKILDERGEDFDLLLTDIAMPHINGKELARHARSMNSSLPLIFITGNIRDMLEDADFEEKAIALQKPMRVEDLLVHVRSLLRSKKAA